MRNHDVAEGLVQEHPLISGLARFLTRRGLHKSTVDYLRHRTFFAYPGTLWLRMAVDIREAGAKEAISYRQSLDPKDTAEALNAWLRKSPAIHNIVFDLLDVTILDVRSMLHLFEATGLDGTGRYCVCQGELRDILLGQKAIDEKCVFPTERAMLNQLRDVPSTRLCRIQLPKELELMSLDAALLEQAPSLILHNFDAIAFDMSAVSSVSFRAHAMLSPIIHSLAHKHGILATILNPKPKILKDIITHGSLRVMRSYIIQVPQLYLQSNDPVGSESGVVPMKAFGGNELSRVQELFTRRLMQILHYYQWWMGDVSRISKGATPRTITNLASVYNSLMNIVNELVDNVAHHANGLGYLMVELNPLPKMGLSIYVGDTGIGLARGISRGYKMKISSNAEAVQMSLQLADYIGKRRRLPGTLAFGGRGLEHVGVMLKRLSGTLWIRSGNAMAAFSPKNGREPFEIHEGLYDIQGTHVHIHIPTQWEALP
jgi:hypothetical protein